MYKISKDNYNNLTHDLNVLFINEIDNTDSCKRVQKITKQILKYYFETI